MSAEAAAHLCQLWEQLEFFTVARTIAREPEDVLSIDIHVMSNRRHGSSPIMIGYEPNVGYKRMCDVPEKDRWRARILWRYFYGFTEEGHRFSSDRHNGLNWFFGHGDPLLTFGRAANHTSIYDRPETGQLICGIVEETDKGTRLSKWFVCDESFRLLVACIREGTKLTEQELGRRLLTFSSPDNYWALARLILFDNVQAFVDCIRIGNPVPTIGQLYMGHPLTISSAPASIGTHPAYGQPVGRGDSRVDWKGMWIQSGFAQFVHELSRTLNEPRWWDEFLRLTASQGVLHSHPNHGGVCQACMHGNPDWFKQYCEGGGGMNWPHQMGPHSS